MSAADVVCVKRCFFWLFRDKGVADSSERWQVFAERSDKEKVVVKTAFQKSVSATMKSLVFICIFSHMNERMAEGRLYAKMQRKMDRRIALGCR